MIAPVELVRELLHYRDMRTVSSRDWGLVTALLAGSTLAFPVLTPLAIGSLCALGIHKLRKALRPRDQIAGIAMPMTPAAAGAHTVYGIARRFRATIASLFDDAPVLAEHAVVRDRDGNVLLRRSEGAAFFVDIEDDEPVLVTGFSRVTSATVLARRTHLPRGDRRLARMGVPADLAISGELEVTSVTPGGPALAVTGVVEEENVAELAFHRDGGRVPVMRGRAGAPVLVADRRLIAASL